MTGYETIGAIAAQLHGRMSLPLAQAIAVNATAIRTSPMRAEFSDALHRFVDNFGPLDSPTCAYARSCEEGEAWDEAIEALGVIDPHYLQVMRQTGRA